MAGEPGAAGVRVVGAQQGLLEGVDELGYIMKQDAAISAYESQRVDSINTLA